MNKPNEPDRKNISGILNRLRTAERFDSRPRNAERNIRPTFLGAPLLAADDGHFRINLTGCALFKGIPQFIRTLANQFFEQVRNADADILIHQPVDDALTPELCALDIRSVSLFALFETGRLLAADRDAFCQNLLQAFSAIQLLWRESQNPDRVPVNQPASWLFAFQREKEEENYDILFEFEKESRFIRLTVDRTWKPRLNLKRIPHRDALHSGHQLLLQDVDALANALATAIHHECQNQREEYVEVPGRRPVLFEMLAANGLREVDSIRFRWDSTRMVSFLLGEQDDIPELLGRILLLLENETAAALLNEHRVIEVISGERRAFLDLSRRDTCLNINLDERREIPSLLAHLERMPSLNTFTEQHHDLFAGLSIVLVHHLTSEVLGVIEALNRMGCDALHTLFIRYKGLIPDSFVEALLALPEDRFAFHALQQMDSNDLLCGMYVLSRQFSPLAGLEALDTHLHTRPVEYTPAMRMATAHIFFHEIIRAKQQNGQVLLIEDGGYLAPLLNRFCLENKTVADFMQHFRIPNENHPLPDGTCAEDCPLADWLKGTVRATIEHTRNGYDQLHAVQQAFGHLHIPAYTIALSHCKNIEEARACALSLLMSTELIMNSLGDCLYNRHGCVIGSHGNIGRFLLALFANRLPSNAVTGIDLAVDTARALLCDAPEYPSLDAVPPEHFLQLDTFIGVTGVSVLKRHHLEKLLLHGKSRRLYLSSGSTKTAEYADISQWIQELRDAPNPTLGPHPVELRATDLRDPLTNANMGTRIRLAIRRSDTLTDPREIILLADGMPVNFLFYGVPGEVIDNVMTELMHMAALPCRHQLPLHTSGIHALDVDIDKQGKPLHPTPATQTKGN